MVVTRYAPSIIAPPAHTFPSIWRPDLVHAFWPHTNHCPGKSDALSGSVVSGGTKYDFGHRRCHKSQKLPVTITILASYLSSHHIRPQPYSTMSSLVQWGSSVPDENAYGNLSSSSPSHASQVCTLPWLWLRLRFALQASNLGEHASRARQHAASGWVQGPA